MVRQCLNPASRQFFAAVQVPADIHVRTAGRGKPITTALTAAQRHETRLRRRCSWSECQWRRPVVGALPRAQPALSAVRAIPPGPAAPACAVVTSGPPFAAAPTHRDAKSASIAPPIGIAPGSSRPATASSSIEQRHAQRKIGDYRYVPCSSSPASSSGLGVANTPWPTPAIAHSLFSFPSRVLEMRNDLLGDLVHGLVTVRETRDVEDDVVNSGRDGRL